MYTHMKYLCMQDNTELPSHPLANTSAYSNLSYRKKCQCSQATVTTRSPLWWRVTMKTADSKACWLSTVTEILFLERDVTLIFFPCIFMWWTPQTELPRLHGSGSRNRPEMLGENLKKGKKKQKCMHAVHERFAPCLHCKRAHEAHISIYRT